MKLMKIMDRHKGDELIYSEMRYVIDYKFQLVKRTIRR